jgi:hypothetical protein
LSFLYLSKLLQFFLICVLWCLFYVTTCLLNKFQHTKDQTNPSLFTIVLISIETVQGTFQCWFSRHVSFLVFKQQKWTPILHLVSSSHAIFKTSLIFTGDKLVETVTNETRYGVSNMATTNISASCSGTLTVFFQTDDQVSQSILA